MCNFGDVLKQKIYLLKNAIKNKNSNNAFWKVLQDIIVEDIKKFNQPIDSNILIPIYYKILKNNEQYLPDFVLERLKSNNQERYRVILRNLVTSNAFHKDGLANKPNIIANKKLNKNRRGEKIIYQYKGENQ